VKIKLLLPRWPEPDHRPLLAPLLAEQKPDGAITDHQKREVIRRRDHGDETLAITHGVKGYNRTAPAPLPLKMGEKGQKGENLQVTHKGGGGGNE
jgi:hypothetical protein